MIVAATPILSAPLTQDALEAYIELVDKCAREHLDFPIANGSAAHARILIAKLFEVATGSVKLVSGTLRQFSREQKVEIYSYRPVIERAKTFLRRKNTNLEILVQSGTIDGDTDNVFLRELAADPNRVGNISVYLPKGGLLDVETAHFMVSDGSAYRMETGSDANPNNRGIAAIANFGDFRAAKGLTAYFEKLKKYLSIGDHLVNRLEVSPGQALTLA